MDEKKFPDLTPYLTKIGYPPVSSGWDGSAVRYTLWSDDDESIVRSVQVVQDGYGSARLTALVYDVYNRGRYWNFILHTWDGKDVKEMIAKAISADPKDYRAEVEQAIEEIRHRVRRK